MKSEQKDSGINIYHIWIVLFVIGFVVRYFFGSTNPGTTAGIFAVVLIAGIIITIFLRREKS